MDPRLRAYIVLRDGGCVARFVNSPTWANRWPMLMGLPDPGVCRNEFGGLVSPYSLVGLTVDHVKKDLRMGVRAEDHPDRMWTLCPHHHGLSKMAGSQWATQEVVREAARLYIVAANEAAAKAGFPVADPVWWEAA